MHLAFRVVGLHLLVFALVASLALLQSRIIVLIHLLVKLTTMFPTLIVSCIARPREHYSYRVIERAILQQDEHTQAR